MSVIIAELGDPQFLISINTGGCSEGNQWQTGDPENTMIEWTVNPNDNLLTWSIYTTIDTSTNWLAVGIKDAVSTFHFMFIFNFCSFCFTCCK